MIIKDATRIIRALHAQATELELLVLRTPTGLIREDLTTAAIHISCAADALVVAVSRDSLPKEKAFGETAPDGTDVTEIRT